MKLHDLIALNEEIRALVRAGVPLDEGLTAMALDTPGALGRQVDELGHRLSQGEPLAQVLADPQFGVPPAYQAVVAAGVRAGRLEVALEGIATSARLQLDTRRQATTGLVYPVLVLFMAYAVLVLFVAHVLPRILEAQQELLDWTVPVLEWLTPWSEAAWSWAPWPVLLAVAVLAYGWWRAGRVSSKLSTARGRWAMSPQRMRELSTLGTFCEILALLVEHAVPLPEALELAADACSSGSWRQSVKALAQQLRAGRIASSLPTGESNTTLNGNAGALPRWIIWLTSTPSPRLPVQLRLAAREYRDEAANVAHFLSRFVPLAATTLVSTVVVLSFGLLLWIPMVQLLTALAQP